MPQDVHPPSRDATQMQRLISRLPPTTPVWCSTAGRRLQILPLPVTHLVSITPVNRDVCTSSSVSIDETSSGQVYFLWGRPEESLLWCYKILSSSADAACMYTPGCATCTRTCVDLANWTLLCVYLTLKGCAFIKDFSPCDDTIKKQKRCEIVFVVLFENPGQDQVSEWFSALFLCLPQRALSMFSGCQSVCKVYASAHFMGL